MSLHITLQQLKTEVSKPHSLLSEPEVKEKLDYIVEPCREHLETLNRILRKYNDMDESMRPESLWKKFRFSNGPMQDLTELRSKLSIHMKAIIFFLQLIVVDSLGQIECFLNRLAAVVAELKTKISMVEQKFESARPQETDMATGWPMLDSNNLAHRLQNFQVPQAPQLPLNQQALPIPKPSHPLYPLNSFQPPLNSQLSPTPKPNHPLPFCSTAQLPLQRNHQNLPIPIPEPSLNPPQVPQCHPNLQQTGPFPFVPIPTALQAQPFVPVVPQQYIESNQDSSPHHFSTAQFPQPTLPHQLSPTPEFNYPLPALNHPQAPQLHLNRQQTGPLPFVPMPTAECARPFVPVGPRRQIKNKAQSSTFSWVFMSIFG